MRNYVAVEYTGYGYKGRQARGNADFVTISKRLTENILPLARNFDGVPRGRMKSLSEQNSHRSNMLRVLKILWRLFIRLLICSVVFVFFIWPLARGWWLHHLLTRALNDAASVEIVEHSCRFDHIGEKIYQPVTYATVTLSPEQIQALRQALPITFDYSAHIELFCIFEEHHYIKIVDKDGSTVVLHLCFNCGELVMNDRPVGFGDNDTVRIMPLGWYGRLDKFVTSLGLHPHGPWRVPVKS
jgi:hypothetical protein